VSKRKQPEAELQRALCKHLEARAVTGLTWWAVPNGGLRSKIEAAIMKGTGVKAGVSDLHFLYQHQFFVLELKAPGNKPTVEQLLFMANVHNAGGKAGWTDSLDNAIAKLERWGLLRGVSQGKAA
jgi:hypothetical protein